MYKKSRTSSVCSCLQSKKNTFFTFTQLLWALIGGQGSCDGDKIRKGWKALVMSIVTWIISFTECN